MPHSLSQVLSTWIPAARTLLRRKGKVSPNDEKKHTEPTDSITVKVHKQVMCIDNTQLSTLNISNSEN